VSLLDTGFGCGPEINEQRPHLIFLREVRRDFIVRFLGEESVGKRVHLPVDKIDLIAQDVVQTYLIPAIKKQLTQCSHMPSDKCPYPTAVRLLQL
jgi:hypothetical protein